MLRDGHMNSWFVKKWVNGATFHTQMLIHQARMERAEGGRAMRAARFYQQQLNLVMEKYKHYLERVVSLYLDHDRISVYCCLRFRENQIHRWPVKCSKLRDSYCMKGSELVDRMISKHQISWTNTHFSDLGAQIPVLVRQNNTFHIQI